MVRLDDVPVRDRFAFWWQAVAESVVSVDASSEHVDDFWAEMSTVDLGALRLSRVRCSGFEARRNAHRIRRANADAYQVALSLRGRSGIVQEDQETALAPADLTLYDASRPFLAWSFPGERRAPSRTCGEMSDGLILHVPHDALALPGPTVRRLLARRISGCGSVAALFSGLLQQILAGAARMTRADTERLSGVVVDLLTSVLAHEMETDPSSFVMDPGAVLVLRVQAFVERRLDDSKLSAADVAAAHHVSLRHLQRLFQREGHTITGWIQQRRLERCHRTLADPLMDGRPIRVIAARWGFTNEAHFNRLFRKTYGTPPASYRRQLRHGQSRQG
ncbi:helix-turn-helix domain-containing protein [Nonomuraea sp. CA-218870]|uniref:helix-turn-helix domain-containing protein n=1 Tax=Nonomuraea sp. CA-218870 TaxID=3239998 RepID=UPI003D8CC142